jgi:hypothetical protein
MGWDVDAGTDDLHTPYFTDMYEEAGEPILRMTRLLERRMHEDDFADEQGDFTDGLTSLIGDCPEGEPTYLDAWEKGAPFGDIFIPRADPKLALEALDDAGTPLGRGVWVLDASDHLDPSQVRLTISDRSPGAAFEARAFGPFLVVRSRAPARTVENYLQETLSVQALSTELGIGDAGRNRVTAEEALRRLRSEP